MVGWVKPCLPKARPRIYTTTRDISIPRGEVTWFFSSAGCLPVVWAYLAEPGTAWFWPVAISM